MRGLLKRTAVVRNPCVSRAFLLCIVLPRQHRHSSVKWCIQNSVWNLQATAKEDALEESIRELTNRLKEVTHCNHVEFNWCLVLWHSGNMLCSQLSMFLCVGPGVYWDGWFSTAGCNGTPRSTQPSTLCETVKWVLAIGLSTNKVQGSHASWKVLDLFSLKFQDPESPGKSFCSWKNILENYTSLKSPASLARNLVSWFSAK